jgi:hypothetical protein
MKEEQDDICTRCGATLVNPYEQYQKPTSKDSLQVEAEQGVDWEAVAADQAMTIAMMKQREWVGLTDEDIAEGAKQSWVDKQAFESAVWWAEAKLKENNAYGWQSVANPTEYLDDLRGGADLCGND